MDDSLYIKALDQLWADDPGRVTGRLLREAFTDETVILSSVMTGSLAAAVCRLAGVPVKRRRLRGPDLIVDRIEAVAVEAALRWERALLVGYSVPLPAIGDTRMYLLRAGSVALNSADPDAAVSAALAA